VPPHLKPIVIVALHTGMRKSEILGLRWQDIDFAPRTITVRQTKNNEPKIIPMNRTLYEELQQLPQAPALGVCILQCRGGAL